MTGSLAPSILAHATFNTITFVTVLLTDAASGVNEYPSAVVAVPLLVAGCLLTVLLMRPLRRPVM
jgi:hypothetical protein